jgi:hypothetical protein
MDNVTKNGLIAVGITFGIVVGGYYIIQHIKKGSPKGSAEENFKSLQTNLNVQPNSDGIVVVDFNDKKNIAQFYNNNRIIIFDAKSKAVMVKGTYSEGGKIINLDNGGLLNNSSVYTNLLNSIKK